MSRRPNLETREKILRTAYDLFHEDGLRGVSMDDVARAVGVKKANLFHYYPTKGDLAVAVFDRAADCLKETVIEPFGDPARDPAAAVGEMFRNVASCMRECGCVKGCFMGNLAGELGDGDGRLRGKLVEYLDFWTGEIARYLEGWRRKGYFGRAMKPREAAEAVVSLFEGAVLLCKARRRTEPLENARRMAVGYLKSLR